MRALLALAVVALLVSASVSAGASESIPNRTCPTRVEAPGPFTYKLGRDVVAGRMVFFGLGDGLYVPRARPGEDPTTKVAVGIRFGTPVTVRVIPEGSASVALDYIRADWRREHRRVAGGSGQGAVRFLPCAPSTIGFSDGKPLGRWTAYNGGFLVARTGCVRLRITAAGDRAVTRRVAIGVPTARCR